MTLRVACPRCGETTEADESLPLPEAFPFCSQRCRLIDLGKWFEEEYRIAGRPVRPDTPPPDAE